MMIKVIKGTNEDLLDIKVVEVCSIIDRLRVIHAVMKQNKNAGQNMLKSTIEHLQYENSRKRI